jgi:hypothetical protein
MHLPTTHSLGVRGLDREISALCRHAAVRIVKGDTRSILVDKEDLEGILGPPRFESDVAQRTAVPGVATGLAWTQAGGEILFVEASVHRSSSSGGPGSGIRLQLTGQLGKVMEESVRAALSYVRANLSQVLIAGSHYVVDERDNQSLGGSATNEQKTFASDLGEPLDSCHPRHQQQRLEQYLGMSIDEWEKHVDGLSLVSGIWFRCFQGCWSLAK